MRLIQNTFVHANCLFVFSVDTCNRHKADAETPVSEMIRRLCCKLGITCDLKQWTGLLFAFLNGLFNYGPLAIV